MARKQGVRSMIRNRFEIGAAAFVAAALAVAPGSALAQDRVPTPEGTIWGGLDHEPRPSQVLPQERAAGVAPPPGQETQQTDEVETLYRDLMQSEGQPTR